MNQQVAFMHRKSKMWWRISDVGLDIPKATVGEEGCEIGNPCGA